MKKTNRWMHRSRLAVILPCVLFLWTGIGCSRYYRVTDPATGKAYYTRKVEHSRRRGYVEFKDEQSKSKVTLQSSEVTKISRREFEHDTFEAGK